MGDKAILTEILEASHLTGSFQQYGPKTVIEGIVGREDQPSTSVRYQGFGGETNPEFGADVTTTNNNNNVNGINNNNINKSDGRVDFGSLANRNGSQDATQDAAPSTATTSLPRSSTTASGATSSRPSRMSIGPFRIDSDSDWDSDLDDPLPPLSGSSRGHRRDGAVSASVNGARHISDAHRMHSDIIALTDEWDSLLDDHLPNDRQGNGIGRSWSRRETFTVDEAVDALGFGKFQIKLSILTGIAWMADAMEMMILAILSPALHCDWWLSSWQLALINTIVFSGMMFSSTLWGNICDKYGRRTGLIMCAALTFYFGMLSGAAPSFGWILLLRGLTGFGIGGVPQSITLYSEFLPSTHRARCVVLIEAFWAIGTAMEVGLAYMIMEDYGWRLLLLISALPCLIFCLSCFWLPESARYQVACGQTEQAYATLARIAAENGKPMLIGKLVDNKDSENTKRGRIADLFSEELKVTTILLWFLWMANAFCYYGVVIFTTQMFESGDECHGGIGELGTPLDKQIRESCPLECRKLSKADYGDVLYTTLSEFPGLILTAIIIEWMGRRLTMAVEFAVFSLFTFLLFACLNRPAVTAFIFIARAFISGAFQAAYVYTPEVYPTTMRAIGLGTCSGMARLGAIITPFIAQVAANWSLNVPIAVYGIVSVFAIFAALILPIETKGRRMTD